MWAWGYNYFGQLGNGESRLDSESLVPIKIKEGTNFKKVSSGDSHSLAIDENGNLWAWGNNNHGQLGIGTSDIDDHVFPIKITTGTAFEHVEAGNYTSFAIDANGNLWGCGHNYYGQLADGTTTDSATMKQIKSGTKFTKVSTNQGYAGDVLALDTEGNLWAWGYNNYGQLGIGTTETSYTAVQVKPGTKFIDITNASDNGYAIDENGNLWGWGRNDRGQLVDGTTNNSYLPIQITGSYYDVTFVNNNLTVKTERILSGNDAKAPNLSKPGYTLSWDKNFTNVTSDLVVNAIWSANANTPYKIEHYKQNSSLTGYELEDTENKTGATDSLAIAIAKNYTGFFENTTHPSKVTSGTVDGDGSLILKLYYDRNTYNITLNTNEGTINSGNITEYIYGTNVTLPTDVTKDGYIFNGWYEDSTFIETPITQITSTDIGDKTYYAKWTSNEYTVTFKNEGTIEKTETVEYGSNATAPNLSKPGYTLTWDNDFSNITDDLTVNTIWTANTNTPYKIEHYLRTTDMEVESYSLYETENKTGTTDTSLTAISKTYEGFTENTTHESRIVTGTIAGDGSLVLKFYYDRNTYDITYELNGGTATSTLTSKYLYGKVLILPNKVEKEGYVFAGWYDNSSLSGTPIVSINSTDFGDKTYYAKWIEDDNYYLLSDKHEINENYISKVSPNTSVDQFLSNINTNGNVKVLNLNNTQVNGETLVGTGFTLQVEYDGITYEYEIAVRGDIDGNGKITVTDLSMLNQQIVRRIILTGIKEKAADIDYNGRITVTDLSMMNQALVGRIEL